MRVIGGRFRGRKLLSMQGTRTRPMLGRMRQRLFDILQGQVEGSVFADLYAGTGSVGIEALSRGAKAAVFVESSAQAANLIRRNLATVGAADQAQLRQAPVGEVVDLIDADIFFLGPPLRSRQGVRLHAGCARAAAGTVGDRAARQAARARRAIRVSEKGARRQDGWEPPVHVPARTAGVRLDRVSAAAARHQPVARGVLLTTSSIWSKTQSISSSVTTYGGMKYTMSPYGLSSRLRSRNMAAMRGPIAAR